MTRVVSYDGLPAAAGGAHSLRAKRATDAFERVQRFLEACTVPSDANRAAAWTFRLNSDGPAGRSENDRTVNDRTVSDHSAQLHDFAVQRLGGVRHTARTHREWNVRADAVPDVLEQLVAAGPTAVAKHGAPLAVLTQSLPVHLIDPHTRAPWEGITSTSFSGFEIDGYGRRLGESGVRATFGTTASALSLWLNLPADDRLTSAARQVQDHLPFALSTKHWRLWQPTRAGDGYRASKIASPLAAA